MRKLTQDYCRHREWQVVEEFVEPGLTATDDRRPVFQRMIERACDADKPFDILRQMIGLIDEYT